MMKSAFLPFSLMLLSACAGFGDAASIAAEPAPAARAADDHPGATQIADTGPEPEWAIAVHGGAGVKPREEMTPELEAAYRSTLEDALEAGGAMLADGADGVAAIEAALIVLEDSPLFNAGRGAALDETGNARHDASIMRGDTREAGAVAGSSRIRNPIAGARAVMEKTANVLLHREGADWLAAEEGLALAEPLYFQTDARRQSLMRRRAERPGERADAADPAWRFGTVGAVVLDRSGTISAGTSTGGRTNKRYGRVGDSPIIGAGTYASNASCAVSATGHGEYFMRWTVARDVCARMEFGGETLQDAARAVVLETLVEAGGSGAVIAIDPDGEVVFAMNGRGLYRGVASAQTEPRAGIYAEEPVQ